MNAYLLFVKCFCMLAHLFHQPSVSVDFPSDYTPCYVLREISSTFQLEQNKWNASFMWTHSLQCSSLRKMGTKIQHFRLNYIDGPMSQRCFFFCFSLSYNCFTVCFPYKSCKAAQCSLGLPRLLNAFQDGGQHMFSIWSSSVACQRKHLVGQYFLGRTFSVVFTHSMIPFSSHKYPMTCSPDIYFCKFTLAGRNSTMKQL